jgi:hypothetical protein
MSNRSKSRSKLKDLIIRRGIEHLKLTQQQAEENADQLIQNFSFKHLNYPSTLNDFLTNAGFKANETGNPNHEH